MIGVIVIGLTVLFGAALVTFRPADMDVVHAGRGASEDVQNLIGPVGARIADLLLQLIGVGAFALDFLLLAIGIRTLLGRDLVPTARTVAGGIGASFGGLMLIHLVARWVQIRPLGHEAAGFVGSAIAEFTRAFVSTAGTALVGVILVVTSVSALSGRPLVRMAARGLSRTGRRWGGRARERGIAQLEATRSEWRERRQARTEAKSALAEARRFDEEARAEDEADRLAQEEEAMPVAWHPNTGLYRVPEGNAHVALPDTQPSGTHRAAVADDVSANLDATTGAFPRGMTVAPSVDLIPTPVRTERARADQHTPAPGAPKQGPPQSPAPRAAFVQDPIDHDAAVDCADASNSDRLIPANAPQLGPKTHNIADGHAGVVDATDVMPTLPSPAATFVSVDTADGLDDPLDLWQDDGLDDELDDGELAASPANQRETSATASELVAGADPTELADAAVNTSPGRVITGTGSPRIVMTAALSEPKPAAPASEQGSLEIGDKKVWKLPPHYLVQSPPNRIVSASQAVLVDNARVLEQKLEDFKIIGEVTEIRPGPVVTTYEYKPAAGMRISKIVSLKDDLTMSLSALRVRVVAPIPGRDVVGIEVPNKQRQFVYFREVLDSELFMNSKSSLTVILGKDIEGGPVVSDLAKAPHMLVAGATGTGKSVGINSFLCSMLYKASPDDVKFIMIDPKVLELCIYEGIPHLLLPPISEPHQAELALNWAVREMDRRYRVLAGAKVRNIAGYRAKLPELRENSRKKKMKVMDGKKVLLDANSPGAELLDAPPMPEPMSYIVVVIDEFADLIMASGKEVERSVARLAQKARACGIHVILATQRPSTDVLTGMIKANFPTRVSFQVASSIDSKVVLGSIGAESLLGMGDLLYVPPGTSHLKRCHGTWITDDEVASIADHWKAQGKPNYDMSILEDPEGERLMLDAEENLDTLFEDAVQVAIEAQQASVSFLQRKLGIGYGRAARIIDHMEAKGIVGPQRSANKPREILLSSGEAGL